MTTRPRPRVVLLAATAAVSATAVFARAVTSAPGNAPRATPPAPMRIGAAMSGVVKAIAVKDGDRVVAGQILLELDCRPLDAEIKARRATLATTEAALARVKSEPRPDEVAIGMAAVGVALARAEEAEDAYKRPTALRAGIESPALILQARRDARITAAQLEDARKKLDLLHAGSRVEDIAEAVAKRDAALALVEDGQARRDEGVIKAPAERTVTVLAALGQFVSTAVPTALVQIDPADGR